MAKLWVKYGKSTKYQSFRPELRIRNTGYANNHWQQMHFRDGCFTGAGTYPGISLKEAFDNYMSELKRMNYSQVEPPE